MFTMAAITSSLLMAGMAGYQMYEGNKMKNSAQNDLNNFHRQDISVSPYSNIPISTSGSDLMREESGRNSATMIDASRGDIRSIMGNIPQIAALNNAENRNAQVYLDDQINKRNYAVAGDRTNIRAIQEERDNMDLSGIGTRLNVGRQDFWNGMNGMMSAGIYAVNNIHNTPEAKPLQPMGTNEVISHPQLPSATLPNLK